MIGMITLLCLRSLAGRDSVVKVFKEAQILQTNMGIPAPTGLMPPNAYTPTGISSGFGGIPAIGLPVYFSQVLDAVICTITIDMVYFSGFFAMEMQPRDPMS